MFELARANASLMALGIDPRHDSYSRGLQAPGQSAEDLLIVFVAPPWGNALSERSGLDLRCTQPPVAEVINVTIDALGTYQLLFALPAARLRFCCPVRRGGRGGTPGRSSG